MRTLQYRLEAYFSRYLRPPRTFAVAALSPLTITTESGFFLLHDVLYTRDFFRCVYQKSNVLYIKKYYSIKNRLSYYYLLRTF